MIGSPKGMDLSNAEDSKLQLSEKEDPDRVHQLTKNHRMLPLITSSRPLLLVKDIDHQFAFLLPLFSPELREFVHGSFLSCELSQSNMNCVFPASSSTSFLYAYISLTISMQHVDMHQFETRVSSFTNHPEHPWRLQGNLCPEFMAQWGFYLHVSGGRQQAVCFACGCVIPDWMASDMPSHAHAQFRPQCPWLWIVLFLERGKLELGSLLPTRGVRNVQDLVSHTRILSNHAHNRLEKLLSLVQLVEADSQELAALQAPMVGLVRDMFMQDPEHILFTLCKKFLRYWNTQPNPASERDLGIHVSLLFPKADVLMKDLLQNQRIVAHLPFIPGGMPPSSQFVDPPTPGRLLNFLKSLTSVYGMQVISVESAAPPVSTSTYQSNDSGIGGSIGSNTSTSSITKHTSISQLRPVIPSSNTEPISGSPHTPATTHNPHIHSPPSSSPERSRTPSAPVQRLLRDRICVKCQQRSATQLLLPCRHLSVCGHCLAQPLRECPACGTRFVDSIKVYNS